jgi:hypothetical protein
VKQLLQTTSTDDGMQIDESDKQCQNANDLICESFEPGSKVTLDSAWHSVKQRSQRTSTDDGMQIDDSREQKENAESSIRESLEPASNVPLNSEPRFFSKQRPPRIATDDGIQTDSKTTDSLERDVDPMTLTSKAQP